VGAAGFLFDPDGNADGPGNTRIDQQTVEAVTGQGRIGYECTIAVEDLAAIKTAITANGGKILLDEQEIVGVGTLIRFEDCEGNVACAMRYV
jgi:predicted enzyme related to lactoylglutathione lyase